MATLASYLAVAVVMALALCQDCQAQTNGYVRVNIFFSKTIHDLLYDCRVCYTLTSRTEGYVVYSTSSYADYYGCGLFWWSRCSRYLTPRLFSWSSVR